MNRLVLASLMLIALALGVMLDSGERR